MRISPKCRTFCTIQHIKNQSMQYSIWTKESLKHTCHFNIGQRKYLTKSNLFPLLKYSTTWKEKEIPQCDKNIYKETMANAKINEERMDSFLLKSGTRIPTAATSVQQCTRGSIIIIKKLCKTWFFSSLIPLPVSWYRTFLLCTNKIFIFLIYF